MVSDNDPNPSPVAKDRVRERMMVAKAMVKQLRDAQGPSPDDQLA